ncbi:hypothetical protein, partial [Neisseria meningitidis]|uniref:hypothetical protein n=1 Tax=Neisseria meningitidis TaxID=487 RepID=UPI00351D8542
VIPAQAGIQTFPRRRESRPVGAETYRITRFPQPCILDSHFRGNDGGAVSVFSDKFLKLKISSFPLSWE